MRFQVCIGVDPVTHMDTAVVVVSSDSRPTQYYESTSQQLQQPLARQSQVNPERSTQQQYRMPVCGWYWGNGNDVMDV
jgi:hypothetical protein